VFIEAKDDGGGGISTDLSRLINLPPFLELYTTNFLTTTYR